MAKCIVHRNLLQCRLVGLRKKLALIAMMVVIVAITAMLNVGSVYAQTIVLTPNPVTQGMDVLVTGSDFQQWENAQIEVFVDNGGTCAVIPAMTIAASSDNNGNLEPVTIPTSGLSAGTYCVEGNGFLEAPEAVTLIVSPATTTTTGAAPTIPEYVYGLPIIAVVIVLAYVVMKRRGRDLDES